MYSSIGKQILIEEELGKICVSRNAKKFGVYLEYDVYIHENHTIEVTGGIEAELVEFGLVVNFYNNYSNLFLKSYF
ncbi:MAG TPA: hypothetical protein VMR37_07515 [Rhabdochlamydiaceae bacterium]|jgi:hypothetical protein|nr:hypothetical protein [Rhabdochlamydiaceae bacterium]